MKQLLHLVGALLVLLRGGLLSNEATAQVRFNQHHVFSPPAGYSFLDQIRPRTGGYITIGNRTITAGGMRELLVTLLDTVGTVTSQRVYAHDSVSYTGGMAGALIALPTGGYVQSGQQQDFRWNQRRRAMLWWFDEQGDTVRTTTYSAPPHSLYANHVCRLASGGFVLVGSVTRPRNSVGGFSDWFAIGTDARGRERWRRTWHLLGDGLALNATATPDGGALITGIARPQLQWTDYFYRNHMAAVKIDSTGTTEWQRVYADSTEGTAAYCVPGGYVIGGSYVYLRTPVRTLERVALYRLDSVGNLLSRRDYGPEMDNATSMRMHQLADGSLVLGGISSDASQRPTTGVSAITGFALKLCPDGDSVWYRTYRYYSNPNCNNYLWDFVPTPDGGFAGAGFLHARAAGGLAAEAWVFKTDADGYVTAGGAPSGVVCRPVGLPGEGDTPAPVQVWPNPAPDGRFRLGGALPGTTYAVLDATGRVVATGTVRAAEPELDLGAQAPGLYLLRLTWPNGRTGTCKLIR